MKVSSFLSLCLLILSLQLSLVKKSLAQKIVRYQITMWTSNTMQLWDGTRVPIYSFQDRLLTPPHPLPGPTIYANEGDSVIITARNISRPHDHTIHLHGLDVDTRNDGDPATSFAIPHGKDCTYTFRATHAGTYIYHCHYMDVVHVQMGMYGSLIVRAAEGKKTAWTNGPSFDKEYSWLNSEIDHIWHDSIPKRPEHTITIPLPPYQPKYFLINGRSRHQLQDTNTQISAVVNQRVYLRLANIGYYYNKITFPTGIKAEVIDSDGRPLPKSSFINSIEISPGERYGVMLSADAETKDSIIVEYKNMNTYQTKGVEKVQIQFAQPNGTEQSQEIIWNVYPNPSQDWLNIMMQTTQEPKTLKIFNNLGKVVLEKTYSASDNFAQVDCSPIETGVYWLQYRMNNELKTQKISIIK